MWCNPIREGTEERNEAVARQEEPRATDVSSLSLLKLRCDDWTRFHPARLGSPAHSFFLHSSPGVPSPPFSYVSFNFPPVCWVEQVDDVNIPPTPPLVLHRRSRSPQCRFLRGYPSRGLRPHGHRRSRRYLRRSRLHQQFIRQRLLRFHHLNSAVAFPRRLINSHRLNQRWWRGRRRLRHRQYLLRCWQFFFHRQCHSVQRCVLQSSVGSVLGFGKWRAQRPR